jgi:hypothetical protein
MKFKNETRGGRPVRIYATDAGGDYPIHGAYQGDDGQWYSSAWVADGRAYALVREKSAFDLLPLREPSEAAVEEAREKAASREYGIKPTPDLVRAILTAAYEIDGIDGAGE